MHIYSRPGTFKVTLTVTDAFGQSASFSHRVNVPTSLPFAYFTAQPLPGTPHAMAFDASLSQGVGLTYTWNFGDGSNIVAGGPRQQHAYAEAGSYTVILSVDDQFSNQITYSVKVSVS